MIGTAFHIFQGMFMFNRFTAVFTRFSAVLAIALLSMGLSACGGFKVWPFGADDATATSRGPAGSTEYQCDKSKRFYVKPQDGGVWLVLPDRELQLSKAAEGQFSNGITKLSLQGENATLDDGYKHDFNNCKINLPAKQ